MLQSAVIDAAYMMFMPSVGFIVGICVMGALYEGVIIPQRLARLREAIAAKARLIKFAERRIRLADSQIRFLSKQVKRISPRRDKKGRYSS